MPQKARIFLIDDHLLVREALSALIDRELDLEVCGQSGEADEAVELIGATKPDVVVLDISLRGSSGLDLIASIKAVQPTVRIIVFSVYDESLCADRALHAGEVRGARFRCKPDAKRVACGAVRG